MVKTIVETLKKSLNLIRNMFTEDNLAAASIAQIFGSELLKVQNSAQTDSGQTPNIVNMDPKSFLVGNTQHRSNQKIEEQRLIKLYSEKLKLVTHYLTINILPLFLKNYNQIR